MRQSQRADHSPAGRWTAHNGPPSETHRRYVFPRTSPGETHHEAPGHRLRWVHALRVGQIATNPRTDSAVSSKTQRPSGHPAPHRRDQVFRASQLMLVRTRIRMTVRRWGVMGECDARTQGAADTRRIGATEDEAACRPARSSGTSLILIRVLIARTVDDVPDRGTRNQHVPRPGRPDRGMLDDLPPLFGWCDR